MNSDFTGEPGSPPPAGGQPSARGRMIAAGVLAAGLAAGVTIVALAGGGGDVAPRADPRCVADWNDDPRAVRFGRHQSLAHQYARVQVTHLAADGGPVAEGERGRCAVVFAAQALDAEPGAAAQILNEKGWEPVSGLSAGTPQRLGELQSGALAGANATLSADGRLTPD